eukprot:2840490-Rhodomonas_salina.1
MDMLGVPFAVTLDPETLRDHAVTVRERDSMAQVRPAPAPANALDFAGAVVLTQRGWFRSGYRYRRLRRSSPPSARSLTSRATRHGPMPCAVSPSNLGVPGYPNFFSSFG